MRNLILLALVHLLALVAVIYMITVQFHWATVGLAFLWALLCGLSITAGYHRLFSHRAYAASPWLRAFYLLFGAAAVQNSARTWVSDHRIHHAHTDQELDPYDIRRGFWWAHVGWIFHERPGGHVRNRQPDIDSDPLVIWQERLYIPLAILIGVVVPGAIGALWHDAIGAMLVAGPLRVVLQWQTTFCVNSVTHTFGSQPYSDRVSARDSHLAALVTFGEGYHNFHHRFPSDYRNGIRWFHFDPTKWWIWACAKLGLASQLLRTSAERIRTARARMQAEISADIDEPATHA